MSVTWSMCSGTSSRTVDGGSTSFSITLERVWITESGLKITPLDAAVPDTAQALIDQTAMVLPHVKITELLLEVDEWTGFTRHFTHLKSGDLAKDKNWRKNPAYYVQYAHARTHGIERKALEAGIEIMAQPPGKRLQSVNLLSGGEKTMTAIALLVSVFQVRPSPFFLLDEVDAALDDANVGRFNEIVKDLADTSQFLPVT